MKNATECNESSAVGTVSDETMRLEEALYEGNVTPRVARYKYTDTDGEHLHTLDGIPLTGTSTVVNEGLPAFGLTWWAASLAGIECMEAGCEPNKTIREEFAEAQAMVGKDKKNALARLQRKYPLFKKARYAHRDARDSAAQPGTDMHAELERYVKECIYENAGAPLPCILNADAPVQIFSEWALEFVAEFLWSEGHCYSENMWTGGICDLGVLLKTDKIAIADFKSSKEAFPKNFAQCGGYAEAVSENGVLDANGARVYPPVDADELIIWPFGAPNPAPAIRRDVSNCIGGFKHALGSHKFLQSFE